MSQPKIDKSIAALPVLKQVRRIHVFFYNKHLDLQFSDFKLKVLNRLLRLLVFSKDIKKKDLRKFLFLYSYPSLENNIYNAILICLGQHCIGTASSQYCPIDDS